MIHLTNLPVLNTNSEFLVLLLFMSFFRGAEVLGLSNFSNWHRCSWKTVGPDLPGLPDLVKKQRVCFSFKISLEEKDWCSRSGKYF